MTQYHDEHENEYDLRHSASRLREVRLERLRRIRRLALSRGDEALADLLDLMIEEELGP